MLDASRRSCCSVARGESSSDEEAEPEDDRSEKHSKEERSEKSTRNSRLLRHRLGIGTPRPVVGNQTHAQAIGRRGRPERAPKRGHRRKGTGRRRRQEHHRRDERYHRCPPAAFRLAVAHQGRGRVLPAPAHHRIHPDGAPPSGAGPPPLRTAFVPLQTPDSTPLNQRQAGEELSAAALHRVHRRPDRPVRTLQRLLIPVEFELGGCHTLALDLARRRHLSHPDRRHDSRR